jgi:Ca2+-binding RTX toxin-like protein
MVEFNFTYQPGTTVQQMIGFEVAGRIWGQVLSDQVTVNVHVAATTDLPANVLAGSLPARLQAKVGDYWDKLGIDATSSEDATMLRRRGDQVRAWFDLYQYDWYRRLLKNQGYIESSEDMQLTQANSKAIDLMPANTPGLDGFIVIRDLSDSAIPWSYNFSRNTGNEPTSVDFLSVALHEIGHVLGFASGVDRPGWLPSKPKSHTETIDYINSLAERIQFATPLDLTRYSYETYGTGANDLSQGGMQGFSVDGGWRYANFFSSGVLLSEGGDGSQASHWKQGGFSRDLMEPALSLGEQVSIAYSDRLALDVIGWDLGVDPGSLNLTDILAQAREGLANRIGKSPDWLDAHATAAAAQLSQDLMYDVLTMLDGSQYEGRKNSRTGSWQEVMDAFWMEGLFDTFDLGLLSPWKNRSRSIRTLVNGSDQGGELLGSRYHEQLVGGDGDDVIHGGSGHDNLRGGDGDDWLVGDRGVDVLHGGEGTDTFVVQLASGIDIVKDFTAGEDLLVLGIGLRWNDLDMVQDNNHLVISQGDTPLMVVANTDLSTLR